MDLTGVEEWDAWLTETQNLPFASLLSNATNLYAQHQQWREQQMAMDSLEYMSAMPELTAYERGPASHSGTSHLMTLIPCLSARRIVSYVPRLFGPGMAIKATV